MHHEKQPEEKDIVQVERVQGVQSFDDLDDAEQSVDGKITWQVIFAFIVRSFSEHRIQIANLDASKGPRRSGKRL